MRTIKNMIGYIVCFMVYVFLIVYAIVSGVLGTLAMITDRYISKPLNNAHGSMHKNLINWCYSIEHDCH